MRVLRTKGPILKRNCHHIDIVVFTLVFAQTKSKRLIQSMDSNWGRKLFKTLTNSKGMSRTKAPELDKQISMTFRICPEMLHSPLPGTLRHVRYGVKVIGVDVRINFDGLAPLNAAVFSISIYSIEVRICCRD